MTPQAPPRCVLYVEDEPLNVLLMQEIFKTQSAWALHVARDGHEGVEAAIRLQPDLALIDMHLPDFNGLEVLRRLREHPHTQALRCIALSADAMEEDVAAARAAGFDDYWTKPIDLVHLLTAIGRVLDLPAASPPKEKPAAL
jgi:CheY-like chemotaxis protein